MAGRPDTQRSTVEKKRACETSRHAVFGECPLCGSEMAPEHAHYRCTSCGWRDSCCD